MKSFGRKIFGGQKWGENLFVRNFPLRKFREQVFEEQILLEANFWEGNNGSKNFGRIFLRVKFQPGKKRILVSRNVLKKKFGKQYLGNKMFSGKRDTIL